MNYIEAELYAIAPFPILNCDKNGQFRMKLTSGTDAHNKRQTRWMNLTPEQFKALEYMVATHPAFNTEAVE